MATENDITQDETLDEDLASQSVTPTESPAPAAADPIPRSEEPAPAPAAAASASRPEESRSSGPAARLLSEQEATELRKVYGDPKMQRLVRRLVAGAVIALIVGAGVLYQWSRTENETTWPGMATGQIDDGEEEFKLDGETVGLVYFPHAPGWSINRQDEGNLDVYSCIGKHHDVPFHLSFTSRKLKDGFSRTLDDTFVDFAAERKQKGEIMYAHEVERFYVNTDLGHGVPVLATYGVRPVAGHPYYHRVTYFRYRDWECVVERGCPVEAVAARKLLKEIDCLVIYDNAAAAHFSIPAKRVPGNPIQLLRTVRANMARNLDVADWRSIDGTLRTLLATAYETDDKDLIAEVADAWGDWRRSQESWYMKKRFAFGEAFAHNDRETCNALRRLCVEKFEGTDDARRGRNIGAQWEVY